MANITINWDNPEKTLIFLRYISDYAWSELDIITEQMYAMLRSVPHTVDVIVVLNPMIKPPAGGDIMSRLRKILAGMPDNLGLYVTVGRGNAFTRIVINSILKIFPSRHEMRSALSEDEALQMVADYRMKQKV